MLKMILCSIASCVAIDLGQVFSYASWQSNNIYHFHDYMSVRLNLMIHLSLPYWSPCNANLDLVELKTDTFWLIDLKI